MNNEELKQIHLGREQIYYMLGNIFIDVPNEEMYKNIETLLPSFKLMAEDDEILNDGINGLEKFLNLRDEKEGEEKVKFDNDVLSNFTRIYCLSDSVPTTESVYVSPEKLSNQEVTGIVSKLQNQYGFIIKNESNEGSDHISYELYFLGHLSSMTANYIEAGNVDMALNIQLVQKNFLEEHLLKWANLFTKATLGYSESAYFYAPACYTLLGFLEVDRGFLEDISK